MTHNASQSSNGVQIKSTGVLFLEAWKRSVRLIGIAYFGDGTDADFEAAESVAQLKPNIALIKQKIFSLNIEDRKFMVFLVSLYDKRAAINLMIECSLTLDDIHVKLSEKYQSAALDLFANYTESGW